MELDRLTEFVRVAQAGSVQAAAASLGVSAATLSARLQRLEEQLGVSLFVRRRTLNLTEAGRQLLPVAQAVLSQLQQIRQDMLLSQAYLESRLRIAVTGSTLPVYLGPFLDRLNLAYPGLELELLDDSRYGIETGLKSGQVDVYFAPVMEDRTPEGLCRIPFAPTSQYVVLPASHPLAERTMLSLRELAGAQFLLYPETAEPAIREFQLRNLRDAGMSYSTYDSDTAAVFHKLLIPVGKGIMLLPNHMMNLPPNSVCIPLGDVPHPATFCFFYDPNNASAHVQAFARDFPAFVKEMMHHQHYAFT